MLEHKKYDRQPEPPPITSTWHTYKHDGSIKTQTLGLAGVWTWEGHILDCDAAVPLASTGIAHKPHMWGKGCQM